jgi:lysophospholipase L1-like esterase
VENIVAMCDLAKAHGIIPIICSIPPCSKFPWRPEIENPGQTIVDINKVLKDYADANGLVYVDFHSAFADERLGLPESFSADGCHPNPESYFPMEEMVLEAIEQLGVKSEE